MLPGRVSARVGGVGKLLSGPKIHVHSADFMLPSPRFNGPCPNSPASASTIGRRPGTSTMPASAWA
jgi:hypothetical protein